MYLITSFAVMHGSATGGAGAVSIAAYTHRCDEASLMEKQHVGQ